MSTIEVTNPGRTFNVQDAADDGKIYGLKKETWLKIAVLAATLLIVVVIANAEGGGLSQFMDRGISYWKFNGGKREDIAAMYTGICLGFALLGGLNAYMFTKREAFSAQIELLKKVKRPAGGNVCDLLGKLGNAKSKAELVDVAKNADSKTIKLAMDSIEGDRESQRMTTITSLLNRCRKGDFKNKTNVEEIIQNEDKVAKRKLYLAIGVAVVAFIVFAAFTGAISTSAAYSFNGHFYRLKSDYVSAGLVAASIGGLACGYILGRRHSW